LSLAAAQKLGIKDEDKVASDLTITLQHMSGPTPPKEMNPEVVKKFVKTPPDLSLLEAPALAAMNRLRQIGNPTDAHLTIFKDFFDKLWPASQPVEVFLLSYLVNLKKEQLEKWRDQGLNVKQLILQTGAAAEEASAIDPRAKPWVEAKLQEAFKLRREGLYYLSIGDSTERLKAKDNLVLASKGFDSVIGDAKDLEEAYRRTDEALVLLPSLAAAFGENPADKPLWDAQDTLEKLLAKLKTPEPVLPPDLKGLSDTLGTQISKIRARFNDEELAARLTRAGNATEIRRLLEYPVWNASQRARIYDAAIAMGQKLAADALAKATTLKPTDALSTATQNLPQSPEWRAQIAIDLLRLDGVTDVKPLADLLSKSKGGSPETWDKLGQSIRKAWGVELVAKFRSFDSPTPEQERIGYVLHPFDERAIPLPEERISRDPAARLRKQETEALWQWLASVHYQPDAELIGRYRETREEMRQYATDMEAVGQLLKLRRR
jgi:hypothetical protein